jgi:hypothetical protein
MFLHHLYICPYKHQIPHMQREKICGNPFLHVCLSSHQNVNKPHAPLAQSGGVGARSCRAVI